MSTTLAAIVNSYNRLPLLKEALPSLRAVLEKCSQDACITIFEAGSTDGSGEYLREQERQSALPMHIIEPKPAAARSFAAGVNRAVQEAAARHPDLRWCFLYETDNYIKNPSALQRALDLMEQRKELGALGFTVERHDGRKAGYGARFPTVLSFILGQQVSSALGLLDPRPDWKRKGKHRFTYEDVVFTSPLLVRYECWKKIGGMDQETFPFTDSDTDLCWRILKSGQRCGVLDATGVVHDNRQVQSEWSGQRVHWFHESRLRVLRRHRDVRVVVVKALLVVRHLLETFGLALLFLLGKRPLEALKTRMELIAAVSSKRES